MTFATYDRALTESKPWIARRKQLGLYVLAAVVQDIITLSLAFTLSYVIRFHSGLPFFDDAPVSADVHLWLSVGLVPVWLLALALWRCYDPHYLLGSTQEYMRVFNASAFVLTLLVLGTFLVPVVRVSRGWLVITWLLSVVYLTGGRFLLRRFAYRLRKRGLFMRRALVIGTDDEARAIARQLVESPISGVQVLGFVGKREEVGTRLEGNLRVVATQISLPVLVDWCEIEELIISSSALPRAELLQVFETFGASDQVELRFSSGLYELYTAGVRVKEIGSVPLVSMNKVRLDGVESAFKSFIDYGAALFVVTAFSWLYLALAILVKLDSPGPILHRRRVVGAGGREFDAFKFRTMYVNGDEILTQHPELAAELKANHKLKDDPRVTRVGKVLRKFSLDELPQIFNILLGQMSLVGPRMITPPEMEKYDKYRMNLLTVKPGITGLWQVSGRSDVSYEERVRLDMHYIRNYSVWLDLQLILQTIPVVLKGKGAY